jgi:hypothetical protein
VYTGTLKSNFYGKMSRLVIHALRSVNLQWLFEKVQIKRFWTNGELDSKILVNRPGRQVVLTTIHEDTELDSFQSDDSVTFLVIGVKLKRQTRKESIVLNEGQLLTLHENIDYSHTTGGKTMLLYIIVKTFPNHSRGGEQEKTLQGFFN